MPLKICLVSQEYPPDTDWGGISTYVYTLANNLTKLGHIVHVVTRSIKNNSYTTLDGDVIVHRIKQPTLSCSINIENASYINNIIYSQAVNDKIQELHKRVGFDIIEFPDFGAEAFQFKGNIPSIVRLHTCSAITQYYNNVKPIQQDIMINYIEKVAAQKVDRIISPTPSVLEMTKKLWDMDLPQNFIPNPVEYNVNLNYKRFDKIPRLLYTGRFEPRKGLYLLIEAMSYVVREIPDVKLTMVGRDTLYGPNGSSYLSQIYKKMRELDLGSHNIRIINQWQDKEMLFRHIFNSDVCVVPSKFESFGYTVVEPLSCGKPVVLTKSTGISYYLKHGEEAFISKDNDAEEFAGYIIKLLKDKNLRDYIGRNAKEASKRFDAKVVVPQIVEMYKDVIKRYNEKNFINISENNFKIDIDKYDSLSICIICYNALEYTKRCINSIRKTTKVPYKIHLLDNGSNDGTREYLESIENDKDIEVIYSDKNLGVPAGRNILIKQANLNKYVVFIDNDVEVFDNWYIPFYSEISKNNNVGILGIEGYKVYIRNFSRYLKPAANGEADIITGYCMFMKKSLIDKLGLFDENLGLYWHDDDDYSIRGVGEGYINKVIESNIYHYGSKSSSQKPDILKIEKSKENLKYLINKWRIMGIINEEGVPCKKKLKLVWEGSQFVYSSLAHINREVALQLIENDDINLKLIPYEPNQFDDSVDPRFRKITEHLIQSPPTDELIDFYIRHQWPPKFKAPNSGKWILMQPWEFGSIPKSWVAPMRDEIDEIWVPSNYVKKCYVDSGIPDNKIQVIPNGVNTEIFKPEGDLFPLNTKKKLKFGFVGGTIWRKGIDILIDAYIKAFTKDDDVTLIIKDSGANTFYKGQTLSAYIKELQNDPEKPEIVYISDDLSTEEMAALFRSIDCLVHPYRGEGFGMPIAEAMACGKPVVVTNFGAALDFCDKDNGFLIPATVRVMPEKMVGDLPTVDYPYIAEPDKDALCNILKQVYMTSKDRLKAMGEKGREKILAGFTWKHMADLIVDRLENLKNTPILRYNISLDDKETLDLINKGLNCIYINPNEALNYFKKGLNLYPNNKFLIRKVIECLINLNRLDDAFIYINKLSDLLLKEYGEINQGLTITGKVEYGKYYNLLGVYYYYNGDKDNAKIYFDKAIKCNPDDEESIKNNNMLSTISLCLITKDEEKNIARCINSVKDIVDEIVVVDTGSKDKTVEIAKSFGEKVKVINAKWEDDFSKARNIAIENATSDWILFLDADEEIKKEDAEKIKPLLYDDTVEAYMFKFINYSGASVSSGLSEIHYNFRLFRNNGKLKYVYPIHENLKNIEDDRAPIFKNADVTILHYGYLSEIRIEKNKTQRYIDMISKYLAKHPNDKFQQGNLAVEYYNAGEYNKALKHLLIATKSMNLNSYATPRLFRYLIMTYIALKEYDTALRIINDAKKYYEDIPDYKYLEGTIYFNQKRYEKALEIFKECALMGEYKGQFVTMGGTGSYRAKYMIGQCYEKLGKLNDAVKEYMEILKQHPNYQDVFIKVFDMFVRNEKPEDVYEFFRKHVNTKVPINYIAIARLYINIGRYDIAKQYIDSIDIDLEGLNNLRGIIYMGLKDYENAIKHFEMEYGKAKEEANYREALCYIILKDIDKAKDLLWKITDSSDKKLYMTIVGEMKAKFDEVKDSFFNLLDLLIKLKEFDFYNEVLNLYVGLFTREEYERYGQMMINNGLDDLAVEAYIKAADLNSQNTEVYKYLAQKAYDQNMFNEALSIIGRAYNLDKTDVDIYRIIYKIYKALGQDKNAYEANEEIKSLYPEIDLSKEFVSV